MFIVNCVKLMNKFDDPFDVDLRIVNVTIITTMANDDRLLATKTKK